MGHARGLRQGDLLALMEPGPTLSPTVRATLIPSIAVLLLEALEAEDATTPAPNAIPDAAEAKEAGDEPDRA